MAAEQVTDNARVVFDSDYLRKDIREAAGGNNVRSMKIRIAGLATTVVLSGGLGIAALVLGVGTAQAEPGFAPLSHDPLDNYSVPHQWCPGQPLPMNDVRWDMGVCHTWFWVPVGGMGNVGQFVWEGDQPPPHGPPPCYGAPICLPGL